MATNLPSRLRPAAALIALAVVLGGCAGGGDDTSFLADFVDPIITPTPTEAALDMLDMESADNRRRGVSLISASPFGGEEVYLKVYRELLREPDPTVRAACARAIGLHGSPEDALLLARAIDHEIDRELSDATVTVLKYNEPDPLVRWEAANGLTKIHNPEAVGPLIQALLRDADADVRGAAANALGQYPQSEVYDALLQGLVDPQFRVVRASRESLKTLTGTDQGVDKDDWLAYRTENPTNLFTEQLTYTYKPWVAPPGFFEKLKFWRPSQRERAQELVPVGRGADPGGSKTPVRPATPTPTPTAQARPAIGLGGPAAS